MTTIDRTRTTGLTEHLMFAALLIPTFLVIAAAGAYVLAKARAERVGTELPDGWFTEDVHP